MLLDRHIKNIEYLRNLLSFLFIIPTLVYAQPFTPGIPAMDVTGYVEYIPGNLPVVISVPHGGYLSPAAISGRDCADPAIVCGRDSYTQELGRSIGNAFFEQTGCYPHLIINLLHRAKFDANREIVNAANGDPTVEQAWHGYHEFIDSAKAKIVQDFGRGMFFDLHGHGHTIQRIELGYRLSKSELQLPDTELDSSIYVTKSSIHTLVGDNLLMLSHSELLRGEFSFGSLIEDIGVPAVPSAPDPFPQTSESYFNGGYNTGLHGSSNGGAIDGIQIECHQSVRFDEVIREAFADSLTTVMNNFIQIHYNDQYAGNYCNQLTNVVTPRKQAAIKVFPNPTRNVLNLETDKKEVTIQLYNCIGQQVHQAKWQGTGIDISFLNPGYYLLKMTEGGNQFGHQWLIKQ